MKETWIIDLEAFVDKAERDGDMLHCHYQDLWFTPVELRAMWAEKRFLWGVVNWEAVPRLDYVAMLRGRAEYNDRNAAALRAKAEAAEKELPGRGKA